MDRPDHTSDAPLSFGGLSEFLDGTPVAAGPALEAGTRLGDVTLIRLIGAGGMGCVYEGHQDSPSRTVAVKLIRSGILSTAASKRFHLEAQILGRLSHPGIARIYSAGIESMAGNAVPYFVMEYVEDARSLTAFSAERNLTTQARIELFRQTAAAVAHGHQRGIVHRDLKPSNMLVDATGQPKIIDFGVARSTDGDVALTTMHTDVGQLVGTLQYMSPEQFSGDVAELDLRADVYALGVVLYELLAGRPPYDVHNRPIHEAARIVTETDPPLLSSVSPRLRGDLSTIVATCLDKDRSRRYSTAAELEADLGRYLRGEAIVASPPRLRDALSRIMRRHRLAAIATLAVAVALLLGTLGTTLYAIRAERQRQLAVAAQQHADEATALAKRQLYIANLQAIQASLATGNMRRVRQAIRENREIIGDPLPLEARCLTAACDAALATIGIGPTSVTDLAWSPNGERLAVKSVPSSESRNEEVKQLLAIPTEKTWTTVPDETLFDTSRFPWRLCDRGSDREEWLQHWAAAGAGWKSSSDTAVNGKPVVARTADGDHLAVQTPDGSVEIWDRGSDEPVCLLSDHRGRLREARFVGGANRILLVNAAGQLGLWDTATGDQVGPTVISSVGQFMVSRDGAVLALSTRDADRGIRVQVVQASDGHERMNVAVNQSPTQSGTLLALSATGDQLAVSSYESTIQLWNTQGAERRGDLAGHDSLVTALAFQPDGQHLASGAANGELRLWDITTRTCQRRLIGHEGYVHAIAFAPDGHQLVSGSADGTIRLWSTDQPAVLGQLPAIGQPTALTLNPTGSRLAVAAENRLELWKTDALTLVRRLPGIQGRPTMLAFSHDGHLLAAAVQDAPAGSRPIVWDVTDGTLVLQAEHQPDISSIAFSPTGDRLLTTDTQGIVTGWNLPSGQPAFSIPLSGTSPIRPAAPVFGVGGRRFASAVRDLFDSASGQSVVNLRPQGLVTALAASADGRLLGSGLALGRILITDFQTGDRVARGIGHVGNVLTVVFSPDGKLLASGGQDGTAQLHDVASGERLLVLRGHEAGVDRVCFTPSGDRLITASSDGTVRIWDTQRGDELLALPGSRDYPGAVALSPDGQRLLTVITDADAQPHVRIWGVSNAAVFTARQPAD
jgi:WD40 repeat protein/tRNA A-37 threonylcarbamoyl transferase component Bud32